MRSSGKGALMAALAMAATSGLALATQSMPAPSRGSSRAYRPTPPKRDTAMQREVAEWNAAVEAKKQAKRDRKRQAPICVSAPTGGEQR